MMDGPGNEINNSNRRQAIIDFVKSHPECDKEVVIEYCKDKGIASRLTVRKTIDELQGEEILKIIKKKNNSKSYKLTVNSENLLVIIPRDLAEIFVQFKDFADTVKKLSQNENEIRHRIENSIYGHSIGEDYQYYRLTESVPLLPYIIIDIINDVFTFYFICILPKKIDDQNHISKLNLIYFENISRMYSYLSKELRTLLPDNESSPSTMDFPEEFYLKSKRYNNFTKACYISYLCAIFGIEDELYNVLDLLWIRNVETVSLMYASDLEYVFTEKELFEMNYKTSLSSVHHMSQLKASNKHLVYNNDMLNKMHDAINSFILTGRGLELDHIVKNYEPIGVGN